MIRQRLEKLSVKLREQHIDHALLSSFISLRYFTGYQATVEIDPSPMTPLLGVLLWLRDKKPILFLADMEPGLGVDQEITKENFSSYTIEAPLHAIADLTAKLLGQLKHLPRGKIGIEAEELPASMLDGLRSACPHLEFLDLKPSLSNLRMVKDAEEIQIMREAIELCDIGQQLAKKLARPGMTEVELFGEVHKAMEVKAGGRVPLLADFVSGPRTALTGGPPSSRKLQPGDLLLTDLVPRHQGYWGDSCNTSAIGEASHEHQKVFEGISAVLMEAIDQVRPGLRACDLDMMVRERVGKLGGAYPHHTGHGLGISWHEEPRIVPYNTTTLEEDMIIALEPGIYFEGRWGLRLEAVLRVTKSGADVITKFCHTL
jgi:Xaa-Pro dipeptidase